MSANWADALSKPCPVEKGTRIKLVRMGNDPDPIEPGATGTVTGGNGGQVWVRWDNGRSLILIPGEDRWEAISTYHGIVKVRCLNCGYETTDVTTMEMWNDYGDCPQCSTDHAEWTLADGTVNITQGGVLT